MDLKKNDQPKNSIPKANGSEFKFKNLVDNLRKENLPEVDINPRLNLLEQGNKVSWINIQFQYFLACV